MTLPEYKGKKTGFVSNSCRYRKKIEPGQRLDILAELKSFRRGLAKGRSIGYVDGEIACEADLEVAIPDIMAKYRPVMK